MNGAHQSDRLRELLDVFIDKFVLCPSCKNPETELVITGKGNNEDMHRDCKACGRQNGIDMRHNLVTFILKNPPKKKEKGKGKKGGMTAEANTGGPMVFDQTAGNGSGEDDVDGSPLTSPAQPSGGVPTSGTDIDAILGKSDPVIESPDVAENIANKLKRLSVNGHSNGNGNGNGHGDEDEEDEAADSPYAILGTWLEENRTASDTEIIAQIKELDIVGKHKVLVEIGRKLFTDDVVTELPKRTTMLSVVGYILSPVTESLLIC